jgi:lipopolysaccharide export system ATP-binding protein
MTTAEPARALVADDLRKRYGARWVVDGVSIRVEPGEIVGLLGPNGAGKTTSFGMIVGNVKADSGRMAVDGNDITEMSMSERARQGLGYLSQERSIFRRLSVADNLRLILEMRDAEPERRTAIFDRVAERFNLHPIIDLRGDTLSGGQQRRVEVARALVTEPSYLLLDEPFSGIDPLTVSELQRLIAELRGDGYGILITDHNVRDTLAITNRSYVIHNGKVIASGVPEELVDNPDARRFFLGENFRMAG